MEMYLIDIRPMVSGGHDEYQVVVYRDAKKVWAVRAATLCEILYSLTEAFKAGKF